MLGFRTVLRRRLRPAAIAVLLCHAGIASALGFGAIHVHSALNEPLDATIDLVSLTPAEVQALDVRMASLDMFERFGIKRSAIAERIRVTTAPGAGDSQLQVRLTTREPVQEPFLRFLIEAETAEGRALREYTVLLDPPGMAPAPSAAVQAPADEAAAAPAAAPPPTPAPATRAAAERQTPASESAGSATGRYGPVRMGETLSRIAAAVRRPGTTLDQMQVAIFRDNPQAFSGNMNVLQQGAMLDIPPVERVRQIAPASARAEVREQRRAFAAPVAQDNAAAPENAGAPVQPAMTEARLRLEPPRESPAGGQDFEAIGFGTVEFGRLAEPAFEASLDAVQRAAPTSAQTPDAQAGLDEPALEAAADSAVEEPMVSEPAPAAPADAPNAGAAEADDYQPLPSPDVDVASTGGEAGGLLHPVNLLLAAAVVVLLIVLLIWNRRRQYKPVPLNFDDGDAARDDTTESGPLGVAPEADDDVPAMDSAAVPGPAPATSAPVAETPTPDARVRTADEQMRVGLFDEARETLEAGLAEHPVHAALQDKRLELEYLVDDADAFAANLQRFEADLSADGVRWAGLAAMGRVLLPHDPRFASSREAPQAFETDTESKAEVVDPESVFESFDAPRSNWGDNELGPVAEPSGDERYFSLDESGEAGDTGAADAGLPRVQDALEPGAGLELPEDRQVGRGDAAKDEIAAEDDEFDWQDSTFEIGSERRHDRGDDPGMRFDLDSDDAAPPTPRTGISPIDESEFDLDSPPQDSGSAPVEDTQDTVEVRLDLARMYLEMEDNEAARELLDEVAAEGNETQQETARALLAQL